jgi:HAD superfamily hydrolase (TIGR01509 family)
MADLDPSRVRWVFFDLDGTLADSLAALYRVYLGFLASLGRPGTPAEFQSLNGPSLPEVVERLKASHGLEAPLAYLLAAYRARVRQAYAEDVRPMAGAAEALDGLKARGLKLALVTTTPSDLADVFLARQGWDRAFDFLACGDQVGRGKPAPDLYLLALARAKVGPAEALAVEDSANGLVSATAAGLAVARFDPSGRDGADQAGLARLTDLLAWFGGQP